MRERPRRALGGVPVIPHKADEKENPVFFAETLYKRRARIERAVGKLKRFKRFALRCEKTARTFLSFVHPSAAFVLSQAIKDICALIKRGID